MTPPLARLSGVVKRFGAVRALDGADLTLAAGEVHGVLGENGAGKSTLFNVLGGLLQPDEGTVEIDGRPVRLRTPRDAWAEGVGLVHQHFTLVPTMTVLENLALGRRSGAGGLRLPFEAVRREARELTDRTGLAVPLEAPVEALGVGERQRVEILKTLLRRPRLLVLDEPTAVLTPGEVGRLFELLRGLVADGAAVALVAHKLDEVLAVSDRVTVLRRGRTVRSAARAEVDAAVLTRAMVGQDEAAVDPERRDAPGVSADAPVVATLRDATVRGPRGDVAVAGASLTVRRGEVVGVAGVEGNGQRELALLLAGRTGPDSGTVDVPREVGFIPQDRTREGVVGDFDLTENLALTLQRAGGYADGPFLRWAAIRARTDALLRTYAVQAPGPWTRARALSGGNQQRVVVARELEVADDLLVAENPSRGLDVAATAFVHDRIRALARRDRAPGVVLVSTDLDEVLELADRVLVMVRGRLMPVPAERRTREGVGELMLSGGPGDGAANGA